MEIPLWVILVPLGATIALTALFLGFNVFHLARYGIKGRGATMMIGLYLVSYGFLLLIGAGMLLDVEWGSSVKVKDISPFSTNGSSNYNL